jgi:lauroyl/myristoyl acyltransferase
MKVAYAGESPWAGVDLLAALRRNEIVAVQGDRPYGGRTVRAPILGRPTAIPAGPWDLARTAGAPILPAAVVFEGHRRLRHVLRDPIRPRSTGEAGEEDGPRRIARAMESLIAEFPEQWFNFYDVWKEGAPRTAPPGDGA